MVKSKERYNCEMMALAREARGVTQKELAEYIGIPQGHISRMEKGELSISDAIAARLSELLKFPASFFEQQSPVTDFTMFHYRKKSRISKKDLNKAEAQMDIVRINIERMLEHVVLPQLNFPNIANPENLRPEDCARELRKFWGIPQGPVKNLTSILEDHGILIYKMKIGVKKIDGIAILKEQGNPIFFMNRDYPTDRYRFTAPHELAHLFIDLHLKLDFGDPEKSANAFAAEFMMPEAEIKEHLYELSLEKLAKLKMIWKMSMQAILKRAETLGTIDRGKAVYLWKQIGSEKIRMVEPVQIDPGEEQPTLLKEIIDAFLQSQSPDQLADFLSISSEDLHEKFLSHSSPRRVNMKGTDLS
jgi:Zn-dependent peptidase ImmA (M78 family)/transcriptional regulator with XRE-family HTH domain